MNSTRTMTKSIFLKVFLVIASLFGIVGAGLGVYFTITYIRRQENHRFESAYIYDLSFSKTIDVDLGVMFPEEEKTQDIRIKSLIIRDIQVTMEFGGEKSNLSDYLVVRFMDEQNEYILSDLIQNKSVFSTKVSKDEEKTVKFTYYINDKFTQPKKEECNFSINIQAKEIPFF